MRKIAITDLVYFSDCRRQWYLGRQWVPKKPQSHFWLGSVVHKGMETYYKRGRQVDLALKVMNVTIQSTLGDMEKQLGETYQFFSQEMDNLAELALGMVTNYSLYDEGEPLEGTVEAVEEYVKIPLMDGVQLTGRIDLIMQRRDGLWVIDHKTSSSSSDMKGLDVDEQLTGYAYLVWKTRGVIPTGLLYNVLIKELPSEPKVLKSGKLSQDTSQKTVYDLYLSKIQEMGLPLIEYSDFLITLQSIGWSKFFTRDGSTRNETEMLSFEKRAKRKGEDIIKILDNPEENAYPSPSTFRCSSCIFLGVCKAMEDGGNVEAMLENHFLPNTWYS